MSHNFTGLKLRMRLFVLLSVLWNVVNTQTFPYVSYMGQTLANHGYVNLSIVEEYNFHCHTDLATCCSGTEGPHRGDWYFPDGTRLPISGSIFEARGNEVVDLIRESGPLPLGMYRCEIPTSAIHDDTDSSARDIVYVGLYSQGGDITIIGNMTASDIAGQFTLTCISTGGPATTVQWTRDSTTVAEETETVLNDPVIAQYTHTLTVTERLGGLYTCTVTNNKPSTAAAQRKIQIASNISLVSSLESPILVGSTVTLTCSVSLAPGPYYDAPKFSWQGPGLPPSNVISNSGVLTLSDITASNAGEYTCIASLYPNISLSTYVTVEIPTHITINVSGVLYAGIALTLTCSYPNIPDLVNTDVQITWSVNGSDVTLYSAYHAGKFIFTLSPLKTSHSGRYSCLLIVAAQQNHDRAQEPAQTDEYRILVEIPQPAIMLTADHVTPIYAGTALTLTCTTTLDPNVDNSESVRIEFNGLNHLSDNVLSYGPVTLLSMGEYARNVTISPVTVKDSGGYTCTVTVSGSSTATSSKDISISVTSLPAPDMNISLSSHAPVIGDPYSLTCSVSRVVPGFVGETSIEWLRQDGKVLNVTLGNRLSLYFSPLNESNSSVYTCKGSLAFNGAIAVAAEITHEILLTAPSGVPQGFKAAVGQRKVEFSWLPPPSVQLNGVITNYTLTCNPVPTSFPWPPSVSSTLTVAGFTPNTTYHCNVTTNNGLGSGPPSNVTFTTQQDYSYFQVRLNGQVLCSQFIVTSTSEKLEQISIQLLRQLMESCAECDKDIIHQPFFVCYSIDSPTYVTYRATLKGTSEMESDSLLSLLMVWVSKQQSIVVSGILMTVDSECMLAIHSLSERECVMPSPTPLVPSTTNTTTTPALSAFTHIVVIGVLVPAILLTLATFITVIVFYTIYKRNCKTTDLHTPTGKERSGSIATSDNKAYKMFSVLEEDGPEYEVVGNAVGSSSVNDKVVELYDIPTPTVHSDQQIR